jgi:hypothetical protein
VADRTASLLIFALLLNGFAAGFNTYLLITGEASGPFLAGLVGLNVAFTVVLALRLGTRSDG